MWKSFMITTIWGKLVICKSFLQSSLSILESIEKFIIIAMSSLITSLPQLVLETTGWLHPNQQTLNSTRRSRGGEGQEEKRSQAFDPQPHSGLDTLDTSVITRDRLLCAGEGSMRRGLSIQQRRSGGPHPYHWCLQSRRPRSSRDGACKLLWIAGPR